MESIKSVRPSLHLSLSGSPQVRLADGSSAPLAPRDAALLAWLALEGPTPRIRLAQLLWPDSPPEAARNALRQRLFQLKKQFGDGLIAGTATLALDDRVRHELAESDSVLGAADHGFGQELSDWLAQQGAAHTGM